MQRGVESIESDGESGEIEGCFGTGVCLPYYVGGGSLTVGVIAVEFAGKEFVVPETCDGDVWAAGAVGDLAFYFVGAL